MKKLLFKELFSIFLFLISIILLAITIVLVIMKNQYAEAFAVITVVLFILSMFNYYNSKSLLENV